MSDFFGIIIGRWILGGIGYLIRKLFYKIALKLRKLKPKNSKANGIEEHIDIEDFGNTLIGGGVIVFIIVLTKC